MAENFLIACFYVCEMRLLYRQVFKLFNDCDRLTDNSKTTAKAIAYNTLR
ncbi:MAG: hypothetical protein V7K46_14480 [Nostoc sp.]